MSTNARIELTYVDPEIVAEGRYFVTYDLACENRSDFEGNSVAKKSVANLRWDCGQRLHALGLQMTQSQILVAPDKNSKIAETKQYIMTKYAALQELLAQTIPDVDLNTIVVISQVQGAMQLGQFTYLVQQSLINKIDKAMDGINDTIENLVNGQLNEAQVQRLHYRLPSDISEMRTVQQMAEAFGIDTRDVRYLIDLLGQAHSRT
jgi:hypothetical protein